MDDRLNQIANRALNKPASALQAGAKEAPEVSRGISESGKKLLHWVANHRPRCLGGFDPFPVSMPQICLDGHAPPKELVENAHAAKIQGPDHVNAIFTLACKCGHATHFVLGHDWENPDYKQRVFVSPIALRCGACGQVTELFDTSIHGYDAELNGIATTHRGEGKRSEFACIMCGSRQFTVLARFEYPADLLDGKKGGICGREQDWFSWFALVGNCAGCGGISKIADFECA